MKIAIDCRLIGQSGIGTFIENVLNNIVCHENVNFLLIGSKKYLHKYETYNNCTIFECTIRSFTLNELLKFPVKAINLCDAFFTPNFNIPIGIKVPIYSTIHDIVFFETDNFCSPLKRNIYKWYVKRALRISKGIFTVSRFSKDRILKYFHSNADIQVIYNGISQELIDYQLEHNKDKEKKGIVFLGNLKKHKGVQLLLKAYQKLIDNEIYMPLTIIGNCNFRTKDEEVVHLLKNNIQHIKFVSNATNQEVYDIISHSAVLVSPSYYEGFGIPPLEAMYLNTNVIISDIPTYKEIYKNYPVTFFKVGDAESLFLALYNFTYKQQDIKAKIEKQYNYKITSDNILQKICKLTKEQSIK